MKTLPEEGHIYGVMLVTRLTAPSQEGRWVYYRNTVTDEWHCSRIDIFMKLYSK